MNKFLFLCFFLVSCGHVQTNYVPQNINTNFASKNYIVRTNFVSKHCVLVLDEERMFVRGEDGTMVEIDDSYIITSSFDGVLVTLFRVTCPNM